MADDYKSVEKYLRNYGLDVGQYDFNGLLHLVLVGIDNLREHHIEADLESYACGITEEESEFIQKLLEYRKKFPEVD